MNKDKFLDYLEKRCEYFESKSNTMYSLETILLLDIFRDVQSGRFDIQESKQ
jgi:hypothetical protein